MRKEFFREVISNGRVLLEEEGEVGEVAVGVPA
jgi:hypothetical protein